MKDTTTNGDCSVLGRVGNRKVYQNRWGNLRGYVGGRFAVEFSPQDDWALWLESPDKFAAETKERQQMCVAIFRAWQHSRQPQL